MALFDYAADEVIARIVYYGPDQAGKTTNLLHIYEKLPAETKGELGTLTTETGRTLVFDFVPPELGRLIRGTRMRVQLCALTGSASSPVARRAVLKGADGVVFVADSRIEALDADEQSLDSLYRNLLRNHVDLSLPMVIQYNRRDSATALPLETLDQKLNQRGLPVFEATATRGLGVAETLRAITRLCFRALAAHYAEAGRLPVAHNRYATPPAAERELPDSPTPERLVPRPAPPLTPQTTRQARVPTSRSMARKSILNPDNDLIEKPRAENEPAAEALPKPPGAPPPTHGE